MNLSVRNENCSVGICELLKLAVKDVDDDDEIDF